MIIFILAIIGCSLCQHIDENLQLSALDKYRTNLTQIALYNADGYNLRGKIPYNTFFIVGGKSFDEKIISHESTSIEIVLSGITLILEREKLFISDNYYIKSTSIDKSESFVYISKNNANGEFIDISQDVEYISIYNKENLLVETINKYKFEQNIIKIDDHEHSLKINILSEQKTYCFPELTIVMCVDMSRSTIKDATSLKDRKIAYWYKNTDSDRLFNFIEKFFNQINFMITPYRIIVKYATWGIVDSFDSENLDFQNIIKGLKSKRNVWFDKGGSNLNDCIDFVNEMQINKDNKKLLFFITDGVLSETHLINEKIKLARKNNYVTYAIAYKGGNDTTIDLLSGSDDRKYYIDNYKKLEEMTYKISENSCEKAKVCVGKIKGIDVEESQLTNLNKLCSNTKTGKYCDYQYCKTGQLSTKLFCDNQKWSGVAKCFGCIYKDLENANLSIQKSGYQTKEDLLSLDCKPGYANEYINTVLFYCNGVKWFYIKNKQHFSFENNKDNVTCKKCIGEAYVSNNKCIRCKNYQRLKKEKNKCVCQKGFRNINEVCKKIICKTNVNNAKLVSSETLERCNGTTFNNSCLINCESHAKSQISSNECLLTGQWSNEFKCDCVEGFIEKEGRCVCGTGFKEEEGKCIKVICKTNVNNAKLVSSETLERCNGTTFNNSCLINCESHAKSQISSNECLSTGQWSDEFKCDCVEGFIEKEGRCVCGTGFKEQKGKCVLENGCLNFPKTIGPVIFDLKSNCKDVTAKTLCNYTCPLKYKTIKSQPICKTNGFWDKSAKCDLIKKENYDLLFILFWIAFALAIISFFALSYYIYRRSKRKKSRREIDNLNLSIISELKSQEEPNIEEVEILIT